MQTLDTMTKAFSEALKELRSALELSQFQVAVLLDMSPTQISRWENGDSEPRSATVRDAMLAKLRAEQRKRAKPPK